MEDNLINKLAFSHPGKIGDALYSLPTIKMLCKKYNAKADFYTSDYCKPLKSLFEYQSYIDKVIIPNSYVIERMDCGVQPWSMPIEDNSYIYTFHLGFRGCPDKALHKYIGESAGLTQEEIPWPCYEFPDKTFLDEPYIVISARNPTSYNDVFKQFIKKCPIKTVQIGLPNEYLDSNSINLTGLSMLDTVSVISKSVGFLGLPFSQLVLANGFQKIPKIGMHNGKNWDMSHVLYSDSNFYPIDPTVEELITIFRL